MALTGARARERQRHRLNLALSWCGTGGTSSLAVYIGNIIFALVQLSGNSRAGNIGTASDVLIGDKSCKWRVGFAFAGGLQGVHSALPEG